MPWAWTIFSAISKINEMKYKLLNSFFKLWGTQSRNSMFKVHALNLTKVYQFPYYCLVSLIGFSHWLFKYFCCKRIIKTDMHLKNQCPLHFTWNLDDLFYKWEKILFIVKNFVFVYCFNGTYIIISFKIKMMWHHVSF